MCAICRSRDLIVALCSCRSFVRIHGDKYLTRFIFSRRCLSGQSAEKVVVHNLVQEDHLSQGLSRPPMIELKPLVLLDSLFQECRRQGEIMVLEGLIIVKEINDAKSGKASGRVISVGLPAYCLFQALLRENDKKPDAISIEEAELWIGVQFLCSYVYIFFKNIL
ncbi:hypothetical protein L1887_47650 [Cichorium endivia]|nr:hypothetical protein L1887_47650 [Cichorium endivia]